MQSLDYTSAQLLSCAKCNGDVVLCVDGALTANGLPFLDAVVANTVDTWTVCGQHQYVYTLTYDENDLADPMTPLTTGDINGIFCGGCLVDYVKNYRMSPFVWAPGDDYTYVMPVGPPPLGAGQPFAMDIVSIVGNVVTLAWHAVTPVP